MYGTTKSIDRVDYRVVRRSRKVDSQQRSEPMTTLDISEIPRSMGQFGRSLENLVRPAESFSRKSGGCSGGCRCGGGCGGSCGCSGGVAATDRGPGAYENGWGAVTGVRGEVQLHRVIETGRVSMPEAITADPEDGAQPASGCNHSPSTAQLWWSATDHRWPEDETTTGGGPPGDCYCDFIADMIRDEIQWIHDHLDILTDDLYNWKVVDICEWLQRQWIICMYGHYGEKVYESPVWKRCVPPPCPPPRTQRPVFPPPPEEGAEKCGPDITRWLPKKINEALAVAAQAGIPDFARYLGWLGVGKYNVGDLMGGDSLRLMVRRGYFDFSESGKSISKSKGCPTGDSCRDTATLCGFCVVGDNVEDVAFGAVCASAFPVEFCQWGADQAAKSKWGTADSAEAHEGISAGAAAGKGGKVTTASLCKAIKKHIGGMKLKMNCAACGEKFGG